MIIAGLILVGKIVALVAAGACIAYAIMVTFNFLKNKIKEFFAKKNAKKVAVADLGALIENCDNKMTLADLETLSDEGYTHFVASVDKNNNVSDVEIIKDKNTDIDEDVERFINNTGEGMVVVEN